MLCFSLGSRVRGNDGILRGNDVGVVFLVGFWELEVLDVFRGDARLFEGWRVECRDVDGLVAFAVFAEGVVESAG